MKLIDRFILKLFATYFFTTLFACLAAIIVISGIDIALDKRHTFLEITYLALQLCPPAIELMAPYVGLLAGMLTFAALYRNSEIISLKIAGLSNFQILRSIFIFSLFIVFFVL